MTTFRADLKGSPEGGLGTLAPYIHETPLDIKDGPKGGKVRAMHLNFYNYIYIIHLLLIIRKLNFSWAKTWLCRPLDWSDWPTTSFSYPSR